MLAVPISGLIGSIIGGKLLNKYKKYKEFIIIYISIGICSEIAFVLTMETGNWVPPFFALLFLGGSLLPI